MVCIVIKYNLVLGGTPTLPDTSLFQSVRNQAYFIVNKYRCLSRAYSFSRANAYSTQRHQYNKYTYDRWRSLTLKEE